MKKYCAVCISVVICLLILCSCSKKEDTHENIVNTSSSEQAENYYFYQTSYCTLSLPEEFKTEVKISVEEKEPYTVTFFSSTDDYELFSIVFESKTDYLLGTLHTDSKNIVIYADFAEISMDNENYDKYCRLQNGIDVIIEGLIKNYNFSVNEAVVE